MIVWLTRLLLLIMGILSIVGLSLWLNKQIQKPFLVIQAAREPEIGIPIFAQFTLTQKLVLPKITRLSRIAIPMYLRNTDQEIRIDLRQQDKLVYRWRLRVLPEQIDRVIEINLPLLPPVLLEEELNITISASGIDHDHQEAAPKVFIETQDSVYPHGNYRIAENEKKGDLSLVLYEEQSNYDILTAQWQISPANLIIQISKVIIVVLLMMALPHIFLKYK